MSGPDQDYATFHAPRFDYLMMLVRRHVGPDDTILDVGLGPFHDRLKAEYPQAVSLGLPLHALDGHIPFDLMTSGHAPIPTDRRFDLILFAEVIEHLYLEPEVPLRALAAALKPGGRLIVQTPNAASLVKRLALLIGRQPYDALRTDPENPGHVREMTRAELIRAVEAAGLSVEQHAFADYFATPGGGPLRGLRGLAQRIFPFLREGQTVVARRS